MRVVRSSITAIVPALLVVASVAGVSTAHGRDEPKSFEAHSRASFAARG
jgi:hypothetical protein